MSMIEIPDPPGYRVVAYRKPQKGEAFLYYKSVEIASRDYVCQFWPILEPTEVWRDATIDDLHRVPLKCRVRDDANEPWLTKQLRGGCIVPSGKWKWLTDGSPWIYCQVLEEDPCSPNES